MSLTNTWARTYTLGDDFNISCIVNGHREDQTVHFVRMREGSDESISENDVIQNSFRKDSRYRVVMVKLENDTLIATLYITGKHVIYTISCCEALWKDIFSMNINTNIARHTAHTILIVN